MTHKPTIEELEKLLEGPDCPIEILPNGEIRAVTDTDTGKKGDETQETYLLIVTLISTKRLSFMTMKRSDAVWIMKGEGHLLNVKEVLWGGPVTEFTSALSGLICR